MAITGFERDDGPLPTRPADIFNSLVGDFAVAALAVSRGFLTPCEHCELPIIPIAGDLRGGELEKIISFLNK